MAAPGKRIHVMQCPNDWEAGGNGIEEARIVTQECDPKQIQNVTLQFLGVKMGFSELPSCGEHFKLLRTIG